MDIRVLRYFLAVAKEGSFSRAADVLFLSQPTLSRQIRDMEEELGATLLIRTNRNVQLTKEGMRLYQRAEEIVTLMDKTQNEFAALGEQVCGDICGDVCIGCGETHVMRRIAEVALSVRKRHPYIHFHLFSGNADDVTERLDKGLLDFGLLINPTDIHKYDFLRVPGKDSWGLLLREDHPLASLEAITPKDIVGTPLIVSRQSMVAGSLSEWMGANIDSADIVATYNLLFNAAVMVEQGLGCALCFDRLANVQAVNGLCFRPLTPPLEVGMNLAWRKHQIFSPAAEIFLHFAQEAFQ